VDRLIDQFPANQQDQVRAMLASTLRGVIAQVLVKKIGGGRAAAMEILLFESGGGLEHPRGKTHQLVSAMQMGMKQAWSS